jgi:hypothetical protein
MEIVCMECLRKMEPKLEGFEIHATDFNKGTYKTGTVYCCPECHAEVVVGTEPYKQWEPGTLQSESGGLILATGEIHEKIRADEARRQLAAWDKRREHLETFFARIASDPCQDRTCADYCTHICSLAAQAMHGEEDNVWHDGRVVVVLNEALVKDALAVYKTAEAANKACYDTHGSAGLDAEAVAKNACVRLDRLEQTIGRKVVLQYEESTKVK